MLHSASAPHTRIEVVRTQRQRLTYQPMLKAVATETIFRILIFGFAATSPAPYRGTCRITAYLPLGSQVTRFTEELAFRSTIWTRDPTRRQIFAWWKSRWLCLQEMFPAQRVEVVSTLSGDGNTAVDGWIGLSGQLMDRWEAARIALRAFCIWRTDTPAFR